MSLESYWTDMGRGIGIRGHMVFGWASAPVVLDARLVGPRFCFSRLVEPFHHMVETVHLKAEDLHHPVEPFHHLVETVHHVVETFHLKAKDIHQLVDALHHKAKDFHLMVELFHHLVGRSDHAPERFPGVPE